MGSGCSVRVKSGYCAACQPPRLALRAPTDPRYGTQRWRRYSKQRLAEHPFCELCGLLAQVTDHKRPVIEAPELFWDDANHRSLCHSCNRTARLAAGRARHGASTHQGGGVSVRRAERDREPGGVKFRQI